MRPNKMISYGIFVVAICFVPLLSTSCGYSDDKIETEGKDVVFFGPREENTAFEEARIPAKDFYAQYRSALEMVKQGNLDQAEDIFKNLIPDAKLMNEKLMLYKDLADLYSQKGNLKAELIYVKLYEEKALNDFKKDEFKERRETLESRLESNPNASAVEHSSNFKSHLSRATTFWALYEDGLKLQELGKYDEAILLFKKGLKEYSYGRPGQAAAMDQIAIAYEAMGNYEEAIKFYELASEATMSEKDRKRLTNIIQTLRQKSGLSEENTTE